MASDYKSYLAANILNEDRIITYRLLSRALQVHVNDAKKMLFEFHQHQNSKKPGTVHASYLIAGRRHPTNLLNTNCQDGSGGEDSHMQCNPPSPSSPRGRLYSNEYTPLSITLVREEDIQQVQKSYECINSVHVYSLGPSSIGGLETLSDANREIAEKYIYQDPVATASTYGTITNKTVKRRIVHHLVPHATPTVPPASKSVTRESKEETIASNISKPKAGLILSSTSTTEAGKDFLNKNIPKGDTLVTKTISTLSNPALSNSEGSGGILASFAKAKPAVKREESNASVNAPISGIASGSVVDDSEMNDASDDDEETYMPPPRDTSGDRQSRKERERALVKMMDEDDDDGSDLPTFPEDSPESRDPETISQNVLPNPTKSMDEYKEVSEGRRRGRRQVIKKKTIKDEEGYLVTKEEPSWESFSEDETVGKPKTSISSASGPRVKRPVGKTGQGNIMSFFAKRT